MLWIAYKNAWWVCMLLTITYAFTHNTLFWVAATPFFLVFLFQLSLTAMLAHKTLKMLKLRSLITEDMEYTTDQLFAMLGPFPMAEPLITDAMLFALFLLVQFGFLRTKVHGNVQTFELK